MMSARERDVVRAAIAALKTGERAPLSSFAQMLGITRPYKRDTPDLAAAVLQKLVERKGEC